MEIPIRFILLMCVAEVVRGQYNEADIGALRQGPGASTRLTGRFAPRQSVRIGTPVVSSKIRRPIPLKSRPVAAEPLEISPFNLRNTRPVFIPPTREPSTPPPQPQQDQPVKPVSEEHEEEPEDAAQAISSLGSISQPSAPYIPSFFSSQSTPRPEPQIIHYRPTASRPPPPPQPQPLQEQNISPVQYRPQKPLKIRKPIEEVHEVRVPIKQTQLASNKKTTKSEYRGKKPVAQVIRRWREDNEDGSITWGFENDDGSFKEEIIGVDCITRGKYGYIDPDGIRREYTYETGIKCDADQEDEEEQNGFVDYSENKLVLPSGKTIDLSSMGKKQARRPGPIYRN
ncbi:proline-, glutamic acid- and leucine-rich protein 1 [Diachasma alloeum]|uniref:proline-, glutamic acid- and leucine-rich protein 1 n=1 Tax=Diachasma alloeum TaxID=454923 RepID=UPI0007383EE4|nr:proline-, glutamic acid- and leucine-rich protein 1 [Diachasma alloeum]